MSRTIFHEDKRITIIKGLDHIYGNFIQIYDNEMLKESSEGEGIVYDWSENFGMETNLTPFPNVLPPDIMVKTYMNYFKPVKPEEMISLSDDDFNDIINTIGDGKLN